MKQKTGRKLLSVLLALALALVLGLVPGLSVPAQATGEIVSVGNYSDLKNAIEGGTATTINVTADIASEWTTGDLYGYTISLSTNREVTIQGSVTTRKISNTAFCVSNGGKLTFKSIIIDGGLSSGTYTSEKSGNVDEVNFLMRVYDTGSEIILDDGATVQNFRTQDHAAIVVGGSFNRYSNKTGGIFTIKNGSTVSNLGGFYGTFRVDATGSVLNMNGGTIENCGSTNVNSSAQYKEATVVYVMNGTFNMTGGTIQNCSGSVSPGTIYLHSKGGTVNITGGTFSNNSATLGGMMYNAGSGGTFTIGGSVNCSGNTGSSMSDNSNNKTSDIYLTNGKTFAINNDSHFCEGAYIGVSTATAPTDGADVQIATGANQTDIQYIHSDLPGTAGIVYCDGTKDWVYVNGTAREITSAHHTHSANTVWLSVAAAKAASSVTQAPTAIDNLTYTGSAQNLVTAGTASGGTMQYSTDNSSYSTNIPTGTDAGIYHVWYKVSGDTNHKDSAPAVVSVTMTLTRYTITYEMNDGSNSENNPSSYTMKSEDITLSSPAARNGYTFIGWTGSNGTTPSTSVTIPSGSSGNKSYTANWQKITYKISFDLNGGELGEGQTNPTSYDIESEKFSPNAPTKKGYDFEGWLLSGDTTGTVSKDLTIPTGTTGDREYIAQWSLHVYALSYDLQGGIASPYNPTSYTIESTDIKLTRPTKQGYDFTGWSGTSVDITMSKDVIIPTGSTGNREYVANWTGNVLPESPDVLRSMSVEISGDETLTTNAGTSASITFTANVKGTYSRGQTRVLSWDSYVLTWTMGNVEGISFTDGTLTVNESAMAGTHEVEITATAVSGDIRGTDTKTVTVTVIEVAPVQTAPVLTCATPSITVKKGGTIASLTVRADVTSLEWLRSGELPEGLTYRTDGNKFVISGTVSSNAEARDYVYTVLARNEAGTSDAMMITITVSGTGSGTPSAVQVPAEEISNMTDEEIAETIGSKTEVELTGNVENLSETIGRLETLTDVKTLDLSQVTGVSELKLEQTTLESITLEGNQSIKKVEITGNETLNLAGSKVETVDAEGCEKLTSINLEGAENLTSLNVKKTNITTLNVKDCAKLEMVDAKGCENLEEVNLEGCESLEYLDVSETAITELDVRDCVNLGTLYCASCDIEDLNFEGCENLETLDCSNNGLLMLNASGLKNLRYLECRHQRAIKPLSRLMNFIDFLFGRGSFGASAADEGADGDLTSYLANVKNLKAYDEAGEEITTEYDPATGEARFSATPYKITYDYDTGFEDVMMDVEVTASESNDKGYAGIGSSGGGCTSVEGIGALVALMMLLVPTSKTKFMK